MSMFDACFDARARDQVLDHKSLDNTTSLLLSREISNLGENRDYQSRDNPDNNSQRKMTVASNYIAMASPVMPFFMLSAFCMLDKFDNYYQQQPEAAENEEAVLRNSYLLCALVAYERDKKKKQDDKKALITASSQEVAIGPVLNQRRIKKPNTFLNEQSALRKFPVRQGNSLAVERLVKQKTLLQARLQGLREMQNYSAANQLSSRLELMEKVLQRLAS